MILSYANVYSAIDSISTAVIQWLIVKASIFVILLIVGFNLCNTDDATYKLYILLINVHSKSF